MLVQIMSRKSRNIHTLPLSNFHFDLPSSAEDKNYQHLEALPEEKHYFGEPVREGHRHDTKSLLFSSIFDQLSSGDGDSLDSIIAGFNNLGNSKSSSSTTLSWGGEASGEASKIVRDELERMDRVLAGTEPIPSNYHAEEYKEWMEFFPNLCVSATPLRSDPLEPLITPPDYEEIIAIDPPNAMDFVCDIDKKLFDEPETLIKKEEIIQKVVDVVYENVCSRLSLAKNHEQTRKSPKHKLSTQNCLKSSHYGRPRSRSTLNLTINIDKSTSEIDIDNYLRISPLTPTSASPKRTTSKRDSSSRSLMSSQISSSKWLKDDSSEDFSSLPFLEDNYTVKNNADVQYRAKFSATIGRTNPRRTSAVAAYPAKGILKNSFTHSHHLQRQSQQVVLPPIEINQFRSVSATPRRSNSQTKCLSALSVNGSNARRLDINGNSAKMTDTVNSGGLNGLRSNHAAFRRNGASRLIRRKTDDFIKDD